MAVLHFDGFDHLGNHAADVDTVLAGGFYLSAIDCDQRTDVPRTGRAAIRITGNTGHLRWLGPATYTTLIVGVGAAINPTLTVGEIFHFEHNTGAAHDQQLEIGTDTLARVVVKDGAGNTLGTSAQGILSALNYAFIEVKIVVDAVNGAVTVRVDDNEVLALIDVNTDQAGSGVVNQVRIRGGGGGRTMDVDDLYVADDSSAVNNDFLGGETRVYSTLPTAAGDAADWTPVGAAANHLAVDETVSDGDTTYNVTDVVGNKDLFAFADLPAGVTTIYAVMPVAMVRREEGGSDDIILKVKLSGTEADSPAIGLDTTYKLKGHIFETRPGGGNWTPANVNDHQAGYELA